MLWILGCGYGEKGELRCEEKRIRGRTMAQVGSDTEEKGHLSETGSQAEGQWDSTPVTNAVMSSLTSGAQGL